MYRASRLSLRFITLVAALLGCEHSPTNLLQESVPIPIALSASVLDASTGGTPGFYFLPPTVATAPAYSGTFDDSLLPQLAVEVCEVDATLVCPHDPIAVYTAATSNSAIRLNPGRDFYFVYWNVAPTAGGSGTVYRARVLATGVELGRIDFVEPIAGRWLPVAFRIERGALDPTDPPVPPAAITTNADGARVGSGLQAGTWTFTLDAPAPAGGLDVQLLSSDPSLLRVAPDAATPGSDIITVSVAQGATTGTFWVQGMENVTGTASLDFTATGHEGSATIDVVPVAADLFGLGASIALAGPDMPFQVRIGAIDAAGTGLHGQQPVRAGGVPLVFTVSNDNAAVSRLVTGAGADQVRSVNVDVGASLSAPDVAGGGIAFDPLGAGTTTVALSHPSVTLLAGATRHVTVTAGLSVATNGVRVGSGLQHAVTVILDAPAPAGGLTIQLESSDPGVLLLAPNATTAGAASTTITANAGTGGASFYVAGVEGASGPVTITATAPGYTTGVGTVTVTPTGVRLLFLSASHSVGGANDPFRVQVGALNQSGTGLYTEQDVRFGGTPIVVDITSSDAAVAQLVTAAGAAQIASVTIPVGLGRSPGDIASGGIEFDPLAPGQTTVTASGTGLVQLPGATLVVTITT